MGRGDPGWEERAGDRPHRLSSLSWEEKLGLWRGVREMRGHVFRVFGTLVEREPLQTGCSHPGAHGRK